MRRTWAIFLVTCILAGLTAWSWHDVLAAPVAEEDVAVITSPQNNAVVRGQVPIMGSADHPQFQFYKVEFAVEPVGGDESWAIVGGIQEQPVVNGQLAVWDTTAIPDGSYSIRLRVVRVDGNYSEYAVVQVVVANAQPEEPTETPTPEETLPPTQTSTPLPPTPTIVIDQPPQATPVGGAAPGITRTPLPTPETESGSINISFVPLQNACLYGAGISLGIFLLFGFIAALRNLIYSVLGRREQ